MVVFVPIGSLKFAELTCNLFKMLWETIILPLNLNSEVSSTSS